MEWSPFITFTLSVHFVCTSGHVTSFPAALTLVSMALAAKGFHNAGVVPNAAVDIAPKHSGTVFGLVNTLGSVSGSSSNSSEIMCHILQQELCIIQPSNIPIYDSLLLMIIVT